MSEFSSRLKISDKMAELILESQNYLYTWLEGSAQCGKSVSAAIMLSLIIENSPPEDNLFLALGYTMTSAKNNIFECGGFGVRYYFGSRCSVGKYQGQDCLKIKTKTGMKYLVAFGTNTKSSNNAWHGWRVAAFLFDEIDRACEESIIEMQQRITAVENPHIIITQNPNIEKHPIYKFLNSLIEKDLVLYSHWILDDNIGLSEKKIQEVKDRYDPESIYYKRYILGQRVNPEGQIYTIRDYNIIDNFDPNDYIEWISVCDQGETLSASVFVLMGLRYDINKHQYGVDVLKKYYYKNDGKNELEVKMFADTAHDYVRFIQECTQIMGKYPDRCYIDIDPEFYRNVVKAFQESGMETSLIKYVIKDDIEQRVKAGLNLLYLGKLRFHNSCDEIIDDFRNALYDTDKIEKSGKFERLKEYSELGHLDGIDAVEYGFTHYKSRLYY